jgi:PAS domain S-box-containing protein
MKIEMSFDRHGRPGRKVRKEASPMRTLNRYLICVSLSLILLVCIGSPAFAADFSKTIKVGVYENQPKIFTDDTGKVSGFWPDIIEYIASAEGWKIGYVQGTWSQCLQRLENNEIDMMPDVAYTDERTATYAFSNETVYTSWSRVYARVGANINSIIDLEGKKIAVLRGSVNVEGEEGIKQLVRTFNINSTFAEVDSYARVLELLKSGEADAGVVTKDYGYQYENDPRIAKTAIIFQPILLRFAFPRGSGLTPYLIGRIDYHVKALKEDNNSIYYRSLDRWMAVKPAEQPAFPGWAMWSLIGFGGLVLLLVAGSSILRYQVRSRTKALSDEITTRNRVEEALRTNERRLASIYDTVGDVIFHLAVEPGGLYRFSSVNAAFTRVTGLPAEAVLGKTVNEIIPEPSLGMVLGKYRQVIAEKTIVRWEETSDYPTGRLIGEVSVAPVYDDAGNCTHLVGSVHDITERKHAEDELKKYREHLEELVKERTGELEEKTVQLERANIRLQELDRLKSVFLATMSHELRTPLNSIIGFTGILQQELVGPVNDEQKKQLGIVRDSSTHLLNLINDVLDISKIEAGQLTVAREPCDLRAAIEKVASNMRLIAGKKGLALEVVIAPEIGTITSDQRRVEQIIFNLISNAIKFTDKGRVIIQCSVKGGEIVTSVTDTGIGIKNKDIDQLFEPFHQIDTGSVRQYEGTGLGLSICRKILDLLGGRIWVESEWGKGSTFSFTLPVQRKA